MKGTFLLHQQNLFAMEKIKEGFKSAKSLSYGEI